MSFTEIISEPEVDVNSNSNTVSKWNAAHHPISYQIQRKDFTVVVVSVPGKHTATLTGLSGLASEEFSLGDFIYVETDTGSGTFEVIEITDPDKIAFQSPDVFAGSGYINNLGRANFFFLVNVWSVDPNDVFTLVGTSINKADSTGLAKIDVSSFLKSLVGYMDEFTYDVINKIDLTLGGKYNISFSENWTGTEGTFSSLATPLKYYTNSAKQIGDLYGSNMGEYVPFEAYDPEDARAKFLSDFNTPTYFPSFPFSLSFIHGDELTGTNTRRYEELFDVNGNSISSGFNSLLVTTAEKPFVNRLMLAQGYASTVKSANVWIEDNAVEVTQRQKIKIDHDCKDFPIYLTWLNKLGGYSYWLFFKSNRRTVNTKIKTQYLTNIGDLETSKGQLNITGKSSSPGISFGARISNDDMDGIESLFESPKVMYLTNPETWEVDSPKWVRVTIKQGSLVLSVSKAASLEVKMSMLLPLINTQEE